MASIALALSSFCTATEACTQESSENVSRCDGGKGNKHNVCSPSRDKRTRGFVVDEELEPSSSFGGLGRDLSSCFEDLGSGHSSNTDDNITTTLTLVSNIALATKTLVSSSAIALKRGRRGDVDPQRFLWSALPSSPPLFVLGER